MVSLLSPKYNNLEPHPKDLIPMMVLELHFPHRTVLEIEITIRNRS